MPGAPRCRTCSRTIAVAAHAEDASRSQPQEHTTRHLGFLSGMSLYRLQLQSTRHARHSAAVTARAQSGSRVVGTRGGAGSRGGKATHRFGSHPRSPSRLS